MFASLFVLVGDHYQLPPLVKVIILVQIAKNIAFLILSQQNFYAFDL